MKRILALLLAIFLLSGCGVFQNQQQYNATYLDVFDTVTTIVGRAKSQEAFSSAAKEIHDALLEYHRLFDIYHDYDGLVNLKTVNEQAGIAPLTVDDRIIQLLLECKRIAEFTDGKVNAAMGSVLKLWHQARTDSLNDPENAYLPDQTALEEAAKHMDFNSVVIDEANSTVFFTDPLVQLDVGAIAKGWAMEQVAKTAPEGLLISVGGSVRATGAKDESGTAWKVGVQNPDGDGYLRTVSITDGCIATSGDYQRTYTVGDKAYHHIIDPDTLYPSQLWRSVTVYCADAGMADALTTALFLLSMDEGQSLLDQFDAQAMWVDTSGQCFYSPDFPQ